MGTKIKSAMGVEVDFDLLRIKQEISAAPSINVDDRLGFVEKRLRRRAKRVGAKPPIKPEDVAVTDPVAPEEAVDDPAPADAPAKADEADSKAPSIKPTRKKSEPAND